MFKHILLPLDGSSFAETAFPAVIQLASRFNSKVTLVQVLQSSHVVTPADGSGALADMLVDLNTHTKSEVERYLKEQKAWLSRQVGTVSTLIVEYEPVAEAILDAVDKVKADTIVMSTHGRGGLSRWVYGSVADKVLRHAVVPVLLIRANHDIASDDVAVVKVREKVENTLPEAESADVLARLVEEGKKPTMADRLIDEHMIDRTSR